MKKIALILVAMLIASSAFARLSVMWGANTGFTIDTFDNDQLIWSLVYSTSQFDNAFEYDSDAKVLKNGDIQLKYDTAANTLSGTGVEVLSTRTIDTSTGAVTMDDGSANGSVESDLYSGDLDETFNGTTYTSGYLYQTVFGLNGDTVSWYMSDMAFEAHNKPETEAAEVMYINGSVDPDSGISAWTGTYDVGDTPGPQPTIPEPATMSLLGLGALALALRRRIQK